MRFALFSSGSFPGSSETIDAGQTHRPRSPCVGSPDVARLGVVQEIHEWVRVEQVVTKERDVEQFPAERRVVH